jgi:hypothetical protein
MRILIQQLKLMRIHIRNPGKNNYDSDNTVHSIMHNTVLYMQNIPVKVGRRAGTSFQHSTMRLYMRLGQSLGYIIPVKVGQRAGTLSSTPP